MTKKYSGTMDDLVNAAQLALTFMPQGEYESGAGSQSAAVLARNALRHALDEHRKKFNIEYMRSIGGEVHEGIVLFNRSDDLSLVIHGIECYLLTIGGSSIPIQRPKNRGELHQVLAALGFQVPACKSEPPPTVE